MFQNEPDLYYKFSPVLMQHIPEETVNAWIEQKERLDPRKLIPALVYYEQKEDKALVRLLKVHTLQEKLTVPRCGQSHFYLSR